MREVVREGNVLVYTMIRTAKLRSASRDARAPGQRMNKSSGSSNRVLGVSAPKSKITAR